MGTGRGSIGDKFDQGYFEISVLVVRDLRVPFRGPIDHHVELRYKGKLYQTSPNWFDQRISPKPIGVESF